MIDPQIVWTLNFYFHVKTDYTIPLIAFLSVGHNDEPTSYNW